MSHRILIIDDEDDIREVAALSLETVAGWQVYVANSGSDNVTVVSGNSFSPLATVALPTGANPVWIASEPTSSKIYVADKGTSETTIIQTVNNTIAQNLLAPSQITNCNICALQQPVMILTN